MVSSYAEAWGGGGDLCSMDTKKEVFNKVSVI